MVYLPPISVANPLVLENGIPIPPISIANPGIYTEGKGGGGGGGGRESPQEPATPNKVEKTKESTIKSRHFSCLRLFLKLSYEISLPNEK